MKIVASQLNDLSNIFDLYHIATEYMKSKNQVHWPEFSEKLVLNELKEQKQWKLVINNTIACIWAIALEDELIWGAKNETPSLYLHRIATNPNYRGQNLVKEVIDWANNYAKSRNLKYLRMDTVGLNKGLISHYEKFGFQFLGAENLINTNGLPAHYKEGAVCLFQKEVA